MSHVVIDNFAPSGLVRALAETWLPRDSGHWHLYDNGKRATKDPERLPQAAKELLRIMSTIDVGSLLGPDDSFPDLEFLHGAGLHQIDSGGSLGLHLDSERHPLLPWRREASVVLYLDDCDGGELELCDANGQQIEAIETKANRLVMFATPGQWHRVNECRSIRRSLCLFYWSRRDGGEQTRALFRD